MNKQKPIEYPSSMDIHIDTSSAEFDGVLWDAEVRGILDEVAEQIFKGKRPQTIKTMCGEKAGEIRYGREKEKEK